MITQFYTEYYVQENVNDNFKINLYRKEYTVTFS